MEVQIDYLNDHHLPLTDIIVDTSPVSADPFSWLDKHIEVWYTTHYKRPARVVRSIGSTICTLIDFEYDTNEVREAAKAYAQEKLTEKIMSRSHLEDNLQKLENEYAMTCDPVRRADLKKNIEQIRGASIADIAKRVVHSVVTINKG